MLLKISIKYQLIKHIDIKFNNVKAISDFDTIDDAWLTVKCIKYSFVINWK